MKFFSVLFSITLNNGPGFFLACIVMYFIKIFSVHDLQKFAQIKNVSSKGKKARLCKINMLRNEK